MGLKGYRLWVMGQLDSTCRAPPLGSSLGVAEQADTSDKSNYFSETIDITLQLQGLKAGAFELRVAARAAALHVESS
jgi:hypothetical protein